MNDMDLDAYSELWKSLYLTTAGMRVILTTYTHRSRLKLHQVTLGFMQ